MLKTIGDLVTVCGLVEHAQTQEDLVWVLFNSREIWLDEEAFQALVDALPPGRRGVSFVNFGTPGQCDIQGIVALTVGPLVRIKVTRKSP